MSTDHLNRSLGTLRLTLFVVAAVAPLAAAIGVLPGALVFGGSAALPLAFVVVALVIGLFSVGYAAISRVLVAGGGFQTYIAHGLGTASANWPRASTCLTRSRPPSSPPASMSMATSPTLSP